MDTELREKGIWFPSPCGDVVLKSDKYNRLHFMPKFPSPYGDMGLKLHLEWFPECKFCNVSVPLRGCGFEIVFAADVESVFGLFPSPCGDVVLKSIVNGAVRAGVLEFPSPCGDVVLKFS